MQDQNGAPPRASLSVIATLGDLNLKRAKRDQYSSGMTPGKMVLSIEIDQPIPPKPPRLPHSITSQDGQELDMRPEELTADELDEAWGATSTRYGRGNGPANEHEFIADHHRAQSNAKCEACDGQKSVTAKMTDEQLSGEIRAEWDEETDGPLNLEEQIALAREEGNDEATNDCEPCKGTGVVSTGKAVKDPTKKALADARKAFDKYAERQREKAQKVYDKALAEYTEEREKWAANAAQYADPLRHYGLVAGVAALFGGQKVRITIEPIETDVFEGFDLMALLGVPQEQAQLTPPRA